MSAGQQALFSCLPTLLWSRSINLPSHLFSYALSMVSIKWENRRSVITPLKRHGHPPCGMLWHGVSRLSRRESWDNIINTQIKTVCPGFKQPRRQQELTSLLHFLAVILPSILTLSNGHFHKEIISVIWLQLPEAKDRVWFYQFVFLFRSRITTTIFSQIMPSWKWPVCSME